MTAVFEDFGIKFQYPENWKLSDGLRDRLPYEIAIESPSGSLWTLHMFPGTSDPVALADEVRLALANQYDSFESTEISEKIGDIEMAGYEVSFFCLDLLIEGNLRYFQTDVYTFVLLTQAEDRDFQQQKPVFAAITKSLIDNL